MFQSGRSNLRDLVVSKDNGIILIPVRIIGSATGTLDEGATTGTSRHTSFTCEVRSELVMSGRCSITTDVESKAVYVVLILGKDKEPS